MMSDDQPELYSSQCAKSPYCQTDKLGVKSSKKISQVSIHIHNL